jgi:hypothetical protein
MRTGATQSNPPVSYEFFNKLIDSSDNGYNYGYGPSIIYDNGIFHMFYCSSGGSGAWDFIRYAYSTDCRIWSGPKIVLTVSNLEIERCACDPSIIYYDAGDGPYYYLFYSGNKTAVQTVVFAARSKNIDGPFLKFTERNTWEVAPPDPKVIIAPKKAMPDGSNWYGAGQQTVLVKSGMLFCWYHDDTAYYPTHKNMIFFSLTTSPTNWPLSVKTNVEAQSVDVKFDPQTGQFVMFHLLERHKQNAYIVRRYSVDGMTWTAPEVICNPDCFVDYAHNPGISSDKRGHLISGRGLIVYGAPYDLNPIYGDSWSYWDLYGSVINAAGSVWNDIPWGWQWQGMSSSHQLALGDYDGDGKTDRAIVHPSTGRWYIIGSIPIQIY